MRYFFTADLHLGHANIIKYCKRPFKNIGEMDYQIIKNWNSRVKDDDTVFVIGDFCFKSCGVNIFKNYRDQLRGNIIFIRGNHDNNSTRTKIEDLTLYLAGNHLLLIHRPDESGPGFDLVLSGHVHDLWKFNTIIDFHAPMTEWDCCNVGIDVWSGFPVKIEEILKEYKTWKRTGVQNLGNWHPKKEGST
jgi:calcineurin-like phosphoesterase family protein